MKEKKNEKPKKNEQTIPDLDLTEKTNSFEPVWFEPLLQNTKKILSSYFPPIPLKTYKRKGGRTFYKGGYSHQFKLPDEKVITSDFVTHISQPNRKGNIAIIILSFQFICMKEVHEWARNDYFKSITRAVKENQSWGGIKNLKKVRVVEEECKERTDSGDFRELYFKTGYRPEINKYYFDIPLEFEFEEEQEKTEEKPGKLRYNKNSGEFFYNNKLVRTFRKTRVYFKTLIELVMESYKYGKKYISYTATSLETHKSPGNVVNDFNKKIFLSKGIPFHIRHDGRTKKIKIVEIKTTKLKK